MGSSFFYEQKVNNTKRRYSKFINYYYYNYYTYCYNGLSNIENTD